MAWETKPPLGTAIDASSQQADSLVGIWAMQDGSGTTISDASGNDYHGNLNTATWATVDGRSCITFDASETTDAFLGTGVFNHTYTSGALSLWMNSDYVNSNDRVLSIGVSTDRIDCLIDSSGYFRGYFRTPPINLGFCSTTYQVVDGAWHHIVVTWKQNELKIYIDGGQEYVETGTFSGSLIGSGSAFRLGRYVAYENSYYTGGIDDVRLYNRNLVQDDITDMHENPWNVFASGDDGRRKKNKIITGGKLAPCQQI